MSKFPDHYELVNDHDKHFEIHDRRDKKTFSVAKKDLHPAHQIHIMKLKKFSDGGYTDEPEFGSWGRMSEQNANSDKELASLIEETEASKMAQLGRDQRFADQQAIYGSAQTPGVMAPTPAEAPQAMPQMQQQAAPAQMPQQAQAPAAAPNPMAGFPTVQSLNGMQGGYEGALRAGAQGQMEQNRQMADLYSRKIDVQEEANIKYQEAMQKYQANADKLSEDILNTKIDPNRYWHEKSEGSKWATAIGVLVSGLGAGLQGSTHNMAAEFLQKSVDRDIDAQKMDLGKKQTLLSDNFRAQGNMIAAEAATRAQYEAMFQGKLAQLSAKTSDPQIMAQAQQQIMDSRLRMMPMLQSVAQNQMVMQIRDTLGKAKQTGQLIDADPASYVPLLVPEARQAEAFKEIGDAQNIRMAAGKTMAAFDKAMAEVKSAKTLFGTFSPGASQQIIANITPTVQDLEGSVRMAVMEYVKNAFIPGPVNNVLGRAAEQRQALADYLTAKSSAPTAKGFGIDLQNFKSTARMQSGQQGGGALEGQTASNAQGQRIIMQNGQWVPLGR